MGGGFGVERFGQAYYGVDGLDLVASSLVLDASTLAILSGSDPSAIECWAEVTVGGVAIPYIESIDIERGIDGKVGLARIYVLCTASAAPASIVANAAVKVTAGVRFGGTTASQQIFVGRVEDWTPPDEGDIRGTLVAYDAAKKFDEADVTGTLQGDLATWIALKASALSLDAGFSVVQKGAAVRIGRHYQWTGIGTAIEVPPYVDSGTVYGGPYPMLSFSTLLEAISVLVSALNKRYCYIDGNGDMVLLDPDYADATDVQFTFTNVISSRPVTRTSERFNRIDYSNHVGYAAGVVNILYEGTYNDAADQATYGVLDLPGGVLNNLPISDAEMSAYAASVATESQRIRREVVTRFNPFIEVGSRHTFPTGAAFVASLSHSIRASGLWLTKMEVWEAAS